MRYVLGEAVRVPGGGPQVNDLVVVGRHGRPMKVLHVYTFISAALVVDNDGVRHIVDFDDMFDRWRNFLQDLIDDEGSVRAA